jgi:acyl-CoA synthetase (NDP forming)
MRCSKAMLEDPVYGVLILPQVVSGELTINRVPIVAGLAEGAGKPICITWINEWLEGPGSALYEANPNTAVFRSTDRCFRALAAWHWRERIRAAPAPRPRSASGRPQATVAQRLLDAAGPRLSESQAKAVLAAYGIPVAQDALVQDADAAVAAAAEIGYPVVLKLDSPDIAHKTEAGVVKLGLADAQAVRRAVADIAAAAGRIVPAPAINGFSVQPMIASGIELVIGARLDPQFGPLIVAGLGGVLVELLADTAVELAPVDHGGALALLKRLEAWKLLTGYRGARGVDIDRVAAIIVAISELATDLAGSIAEIDVNPVICSADRITAVDALIIRRGTAV